MKQNISIYQDKKNTWRLEHTLSVFLSSLRHYRVGKKEGKSMSKIESSLTEHCGIVCVVCLLVFCGLFFLSFFLCVIVVVFFVICFLFVFFFFPLLNTTLSFNSGIRQNRLSYLALSDLTTASK